MRCNIQMVILSRKRLKSWKNRIDSKDYARNNNVPKRILNSVVHIDIGGGKGTGVLAYIAKRSGAITNYESDCVKFHSKLQHRIPVVITCAHILPTKQIAQTATVRAYATKTPILIGRINPRVLYYVDHCLDVALCCFEGPCPGVIHPSLWNTSPPTRVFALHHPHDSQLVYTTGRIVSVESNHVFDNEIVHTADTLPGSSGAPLFGKRDGTWNLLAIHSGFIEIDDRMYNTAISTDVLVELLSEWGYMFVE